MHSKQMLLDGLEQLASVEGYEESSQAGIL